MLPLLMILLMMIVGCQATLSAADEIRINSQFEVVYELASIPRRLPELRYNTNPNWPIAAESNCISWSITFNYGFAASQPDFVIKYVIPHEMAHMISCHYRGSTENDSGDSHDDFWRRAVIRLGGDPNYI